MDAISTRLSVKYMPTSLKLKQEKKAKIAKLNLLYEFINKNQ